VKEAPGSILLYELCGADPERLFSAYCWRVRMPLLHKGLAFRSIPWRFAERDVLAALGCDSVPVLRDGERVLQDSWAIMTDLEDRYPEPSLFGDKGGRSLAQFVRHRADSVLHPAIGRMIASDIPAHLDADSRDHFIRTREARFGRTLSEVTADRAERVGMFRQSLQPLRRLLEEQPFLHGAAPAAADFIAFGEFQWARCTSAFPLLQPGDPVHGWRERMLRLFGGAPAAGRVEDRS